MPQSTKAFQKLKEQLLINTKLAVKKQKEVELKKRISLAKYKRLQALRVKDVPEVLKCDQELKTLAKEAQDPAVKLNETFLAGFITKSANDHSVTHIEDVANYLSYQRTYQELIERYNPGLTMTQGDNIRKSANRVGLSLPEQN